MEAEKSHNLPYASWKLKKANGISSSAQAKKEQCPNASRQKEMDRKREIERETEIDTETQGDRENSPFPCITFLVPQCIG
jgi:hypothetical protein